MDVFLAKKCNANYQVYGFVRFISITNIGKLKKAFNNVCFGQFRVLVEVAQRKMIWLGQEMV